MPQPENQPSGFPEDSHTSESSRHSETLFLLSVCRDEDDAAALRSDLRRSSLRNHKLQRCTQIDDANHLLQVCGFDLAFLRLDDFQSPQAVVNEVRQLDSELAIVGLVSSRRLVSENFELPAGIDAYCRLEDLSPTLLANIVSSVLEQKRRAKEKVHLAQELNFAIESGNLGAWSLDIETGRLSLSKPALEQLTFSSENSFSFLDDLLEHVYPEDQDRLKRLIDLAIETQGDLETNFRISRDALTSSTIEIRGKYRPGGPCEHPTLYGFLRREHKSDNEIQARLQSANEAIRKALALRDDAILAASRELELLMGKLSALQASNSAPAKSDNAPASANEQPAESADNPIASPAQASDDSIAQAAPLPSPEPASQPPSAKPTQRSEGLAIDEQQALQNVIKSITRQKKDQSDNTFPFDFSAESQSDYTEPTPAQDGFVGAAKRLVTITQNGHRISVTLSIENDGAIECERERELLFEILKELLTNVVKHANATECIIALFRDEDEWVLQVEDDGVGLENNLVSISTPLNKFGLFRIRTKLALKGGQLDLTPTFPKGLIARARLPVSLSSRDAERA